MIGFLGLLKPAQSLSLARFSVTGNASVIAGDTLVVTVTALNRDGSTNTSYTGTVHFTSSDPSATLPADYTFVGGDNGVKSFNIVFETAALSQTLIVTDTVIPYIDGAKNVEVFPDALDHFTVSGFPDPYQISLGAENFTVTAYDQYNNVKTDYTGTVTFTSSDGAATLPAPYTFLSGDLGSKTFSATLATPGEQSITATDGAVNASQSNITVRNFSYNSTYFDGTNDHGVFAYSALLDFNHDDAFTINARVKVDATLLTVTNGQNWIDWEDDDGVWAAQVAAGSYTPNGLATAVAAAMAAVNPLKVPVCEYTLGTFKFRLATTGTLFSWFTNTGVHAPQNIVTTLGFTTAPSDYTGSPATTGYTADNDVIPDMISGAICSNVDGNGLIGGYQFGISAEDEGDMSHLVEFIIVEDYNLNRALIIDTQNTFDFISDFRDVQVSYDGSGTAAGVEIRVDNVVQALNIDTDALTGASTQTNHLVWVGASDGLNNYHKGWIDELNIQGKVLSGAESTERYNGGLPDDLNAQAAAATLIAWPREEFESGGVVADQSNVGNNLDMTLANGALIDTVVPT